MQNLRSGWVALAMTGLLLMGSELVLPRSPRSTSVLAQQTKPAIGTVEVVAELDITPGNVTVSRDGRIFATVHPFRPGAVQLIEITGFNTYRPFPNAEWNRKPGIDSQVLNRGLGVVIDSRDRLWVIDSGVAEVPQPPKLVAFDIRTGEVVFRYDFPAETGPIGSFMQDLAVDAERGVAYIADIGGQHDPAIVMVDLNRRTSRRFTGHASLQAEDVDMVIDGKIVQFPNAQGELQPARVAINPITLSADGRTLYYGAMTGKIWWKLPTVYLRNGASDRILALSITRAGPKPISDGASTDAEGNHFFTNLGERAIDQLNRDGKLIRLIQDDRLDWPDNVRFGPGSWLYIAVNQLHRSARFTGGTDLGTPPYRILRVWTGTQGMPGR